MVDVDADGALEVFVYDNVDHWTGLLKWADGKLGSVWMSPSPIKNDVGAQWNRGNSDVFSVAASQPTKIAVTSGEYFGVLQWVNGFIHQTFISQGLPAPTSTIDTITDNSVTISAVGPDGVVYNWAFTYAVYPFHGNIGVPEW